MTVVAPLQSSASGLCRPHDDTGRRRTGARTLAAPTGESVLIFAVAAAALFALGLHMTLGRHIVFGDAQSRFAHTYMVFWNRPAKLSAIGFIWPPLQSMSLLPFVLIKPLATSLVALPLFSALCTALMLSVLGRTLALLGVSRFWRLSLLLVFGLNPLLLCFGSNGMSESLYLMLLSLGLHYVVVWTLGEGRSYRQLALAGIFMALGFLSRYELGAWMAVLTVWIGVVSWRRRRSWADVEAPLLVFLAPAIYTVVVWSFISMQIVGGGPLSWLTRANDQGQGALIANASVSKLLGDVLDVTTKISPALWVVPLGLLALAWIRRDGFALFIAVLVLLGAITTFVLVAGRPAYGLLNTRYNIRSLPPLLIGAGYLMRGTPRPGLASRSVAAVVLILVATGIPTSLNVMLHHPGEADESAWIQTLIGGGTQNDRHNRHLAVTSQQSYTRLAHWVDAHVRRDDEVLTDDAAFAPAMLVSGRPSLFYNLVDQDEAVWLRQVYEPWGRFRYMVVGGPLQPQSGFSKDLITQRYPQAWSGKLPGTRVIWRDGWLAVLKLAPREPLSILLQRAVAASSSPAAAHAQGEFELKATFG